MSEEPRIISCPVQIGVESEESIKQRERIDDFTRRYPHGLDLYGVPELPQRKPLTRLIPAWFDFLYGGE